MATGLEDFTAGYIECALWSDATGENLSEEGNGLDSDGNKIEDAGLEDLAPETLETLKDDAKAFWEANRHLIEADGACLAEERIGCSVEAYAGHDFWLTRNGHGCGFWEDDDWRKAEGDQLTTAAKAFGQSDFYRGDDGKIYLG